MNFIISLQKRKVREEERLYVIEGDKLVKEFLVARFPVITLVAKPEFINSLPSEHKKEIAEIIPSSYEELKKISSLKTPHNALAVVKMPEISIDFGDLTEGLSVALDNIQDPGNLGTIIRAAAWFGIRKIFCSEDCVDVYNSKVIQASMGAVLHVKVFYTSLKELLGKAREEGIKIYGTLLEGKSIYKIKLDEKGIIVLGNESKGIRQEILQLISDRIMIPKINEAETGIDSLNVGMAASVILSEFTRRREI